MPRPRRWTDDDLRAAVAASTSLRQVFTALDISIGGRTWRQLQEHIVRLGLSTDHWIAHGVDPRAGGARRQRVAVDDDALREAIQGARSMADVLRRLDLDPTSGAPRRRVKERIAELGLVTFPFPGQAWARGWLRPRSARPLNELLIARSPYRGANSKLRRRLVAEGRLPARCDRCRITTWNGQLAPLQLDHINGDPSDNRIENLRLLCPNCHAQTDTWCGRNIGNRYSSPDDDP